MITLTRPISYRKNLALFTWIITLLFSLTGYAQTQPDAGQILRELQQQPTLNAPQTEPKLDIEEPVSDPQATGGTRFMLKALNISGNSEIPTDELQALVADLVGAERNLAELNAAATRITAYYRARGYAVARAYLPAQDVKDGVVSINIIEGRIAKQRLDNQSRLPEERVSAFLNRIHEGDVIKSRQIDRSLLLLNDMPGVGSARATLQPGTEVGTSDLLVELKPDAAYTGDIELNNHGYRHTGQHRLIGKLNINNPLKIGDQITLVVLAGDQSSNYGGGVGYRLPIGSDGLHLGAMYIDTYYRFGKELEALNLHGTASGRLVFIDYPFIRSQQDNLFGKIVWEKISITDTVSATHIQVAHLNLSGDHRDLLCGGGTSNLGLSLKLGSLEIGSEPALTIDSASARTNGSYARLTYAASRLQRLNSSNQLSFSLSGQQANKNLSSAEKFSLGGVKGVRAYPNGEGIGDEGYLVNLELLHDFADTLQGTLFLDAGSITINRNPYGPAASNSRSLSGVGIGLNAHVAGGQFKAALSWRTGGGEPTSIPSTAATPAILWVQITKSF